MNDDLRGGKEAEPRAGLENASSIGAAGEDDDVIIGKGENMSMSCDRAALFIPSDLMAF